MSCKMKHACVTVGENPGLVEWNKAMWLCNVKIRIYNSWIIM